MGRALFGTLSVLFLFTTPLLGEVFKGPVKKVDADKGTLTVPVKGKDRTFTVPADAKVTVQVASGVISPEDRLKNEWFQRAAGPRAIGYAVEVTVEKKNGKEIVTKVHLFTPTRREGPGLGRTGSVAVRQP